ncbi:MAG: hypothetical protein OXG42_10070, partial [Chloroflexi bacterium]|nr:hypothetical protein [Chloroflexota bacterium]
SACSPAHWDAVMEIARISIIEGTVPEVIRDWIDDVLLDQYAEKQKDKKRPRPTSKRPEDLEYRYVVITATMLSLKKAYNCHLKRTRNDGKEAFLISGVDPSQCVPEGNSLCDAVGIAWNHLFPSAYVQYGTVEKITDSIAHRLASPNSPTLIRRT